jgi:hypothetical protein
MACRVKLGLGRIGAVIVLTTVHMARAQLAGAELSQTTAGRGEAAKRTAALSQIKRQLILSSCTAQLTAAQVAQAAFAAGFRGGALVNAVAIADAESGFCLDATSPAPEHSYGLWQINVDAHPEYSAGQLLASAPYSANAAYALSTRGTSWVPWTTFNNGAFVNYLVVARGAAAAIDASVIRAVNDLIRVTHDGVRVRATAGGTILGNVNTGATGRITGGPTVATVGTGTYRYIWWNIDFEGKLQDGWSAEDFLARIGTSQGTPTSTPVTPSPTPTSTETPAPARTGTPTSTPTPSCTIGPIVFPHAAASPNPAYSGDSVTLDARASLGPIISYTWTQSSGPAVDLASADCAQATFLTPEVDAPTTLTFQVFVHGSPGGACDISDGTARTSVTVLPQNAHLCVGDCNENGNVTVGEILKLVNVALGNEDRSACNSPDADGDGEITVAEILMAVHNALNGCPAR